MAQLTTTREESGEAIAKLQNQIQRVDECSIQSNHNQETESTQ